MSELRCGPAVNPRGILGSLAAAPVAPPAPPLPPSACALGSAEATPAGELLLRHTFDKAAHVSAGSALNRDETIVQKQSVQKQSVQKQGAGRDGRSLRGALRRAVVSIPARQRRSPLGRATRRLRRPGSRRLRDGASRNVNRRLRVSRSMRGLKSASVRPCVSH